MSSSEQPQKPEPMAAFFTARLDGYEAHMLKDGYDNSYRKFAEMVPADTKTMLDLGCGTGLEMDFIFPRLPSLSVTGIDLTQAMLDKLKQKYPDKKLELIRSSYFDADLGMARFDTAISYCTLHHFTYAEKLGLYRKILKALRPGGMYIEGDYMVETQALEDKAFEEAARVRRENNIPDGMFYHIDTPCTAENQVKLLKQAGFVLVEIVSRHEFDAIICCQKKK